MPKRVAMIVARNFDDAEAMVPKSYLEELGAEVTVIAPERTAVEGKKGTVLLPDTTFAELTEASEAAFDLLLIPGGGAPENLRIVDEAVAFTRRFVQSGRPVASICHGPQLLISAGVLAGRTTTCVNKIRDDVTNAGATYVDEALVIDGNLISSRTPADLPDFHRAIAEAIGLSVPATAGATA